MRTFLVVLVVLFALPLGCAYHQPVTTENSSYPEVRGNVTEEQRAVIDFAFDKLPTDFLNSLKTLDIVADFEHFAFLYVGQKRIAIGHVCRSSDDKKVCIRSDYVSSDLVWHEIAHIYSYSLPKFEREWQRIAGPVYDERYEDYFWVTPSEGLLTYYSRRNHLEDIAEWVECCYVYLYKDKNYWAFQNSNFKKDSRYAKKLALLEKYGFIRYSDYEKLKPLFE